MEDPDQMEEERRLMYVGVTRAKDQLYLVRAFRRMLYGRGQVNEPSRFLRDVLSARGIAADRGLSQGSSSWGDRNQDTRRPLGDSAPASSGVSGWAPGAYLRRPTSLRSDEERTPQFKPGDRVDHGLFGQGIVLKSELTADDEEVTVAFAGKGTKTLMASFAKLRKLE
jgi:DNA helicase-2/ATP-dependent DNA helicase PcrA